MRRICWAHLARGPGMASARLTWSVYRVLCLLGSPGPWTAHAQRTEAPHCGHSPCFHVCDPSRSPGASNNCPWPQRRWKRKPSRRPAATLTSSVLFARPAPPPRKEDEAGAGDPFMLGTKAPQWHPCAVGAEGQCVSCAGVWDEVAAWISRCYPRPTTTTPCSAVCACSVSPLRGSRGTCPRPTELRRRQCHTRRDTPWAGDRALLLPGALVLECPWWAREHVLVCSGCRSWVA